MHIPNVGEVLAGKYRLKRLLGEGGMGMVLEAEHVRLRQPIAIKFLNPALVGVSEIVQRFDREARAAATLRSRHVVRVTDVEQTPDGIPYMVMELLDGADLESEREARGRLPWDEVVDYVLQACSALAEAHDAGIVHRDLKPANLFLARGEGDERIVKVLDFGISKFLEGEDAKLTSAGTVMGTALYMSPEQIRGDGSIDARSDIWSLGVILYELISGEAPWTGPATSVAAAIVSKQVPDLRARCAVPEGLASAIHALLEKDADRRPASIAEVAAALAPFARPGSVGAGAAEQLARRQHRGAARGSEPSLGSLVPSDAGSRLPFGPEIASTMPMAAGPAAAARAAERSTISATTTSAMGAPRKGGLLVRVAAISGVLTVVGIVLILAARAGARGEEPSAPAASVASEAPAPSATAMDPPPAPLPPPSASAPSPAATDAHVSGAPSPAATAAQGSGAPSAAPSERVKRPQANAAPAESVKRAPTSAPAKPRGAPPVATGKPKATEPAPTKYPTRI